MASKSSFERVPMKEKRQALKDHIESVCVNNGEDFIFHQEPKTQMISLSDRLQQLDLMENSSNEIRAMEVFYNGPADNGQFEGQNIEGIFRQSGFQMGTISAFKVAIHYGVNKNQKGEITNRNNFEQLLTGYDPKGLFPSIRETEWLKPTIDGKEYTILLSSIGDGVVPATPKPMGSTSASDGYAHYAEFNVFITDM